MPVVRITLADSYPPERRREIADGVHRALVEGLGCPEGNRFQVVNVVADDDVIYDPDFMSSGRQAVVTIEVTLVRGRAPEKKAAFYEQVANNLESVGVRREDVFVVLVENGREDWSVAGGETLG
jgi:4-oxalocrotonate tautomerase